MAYEVIIIYYLHMPLYFVGHLLNNLLKGAQVDIFEILILGVSSLFFLVISVRLN